MKGVLSHESVPGVTVGKKISQSQKAGNDIFNTGN